MPITSVTNVRTIQASASNSAGGSTTGTAIDLRTTLGGYVVSQVANGATGPTVGCDCIVEVSRDNTNWVEFFHGTALVGNSVSSPFVVKVGAGIQYIRTRFTGNTGQAVTVESYLHEFTSTS